LWHRARLRAARYGGIKVGSRRSPKGGGGLVVASSPPSRCALRRDKRAGWSPHWARLRAARYGGQARLRAARYGWTRARYGGTGRSSRRDDEDPLRNRHGLAREHDT